MNEPITDSPYGAVSEHVRRYLATDGRDGHLDGGVPNLLLTTRGRTTGILRRTALFYTKVGQHLVVVASHMSGGPTAPDWYKNLTKTPLVAVQVKDERFTARARTANARERPPLWAEMTRLWPDYTTYQAGTSREIPVVILDPT